MISDFRDKIESSAGGQLAVSVCRTLQDSGYEAMLVGGCVRDLILGLVPFDFDVATNATPEQIEPLFSRFFFVGQSFGVGLVRKEESTVEVATYREEGPYSDRRRPDHVTFTDRIHDARRRDFTMNAIYFDPITEQMDDPSGRGVDDLEQRLLRCVGKPADRFHEDALRLLRALRFTSCYELTIEEETWEAVKNMIGLISHVSAERIRDELSKGLTRKYPDRFLDLLDTSGALEKLLPEVSALHGCEQPPRFHPEGDVFIHTRLMLRLLKENPSTELAFAVLLHDIGKPSTMTVTDRIRFNSHDRVGANMARGICNRLAFSNVSKQKIVNLVARHMAFINLPSMRKSTLRKFLSDDNIEDELELHRVDSLASHGHLETYDFARQKIEEFCDEDRNRVTLPAPFITGRDLINLGLNPGRDFSGILSAVYDAQLENQFQDQAGAMEFLLAFLQDREKSPGVTG